MNKIILIGNITTDPTIRVTQSGLKTASLAIAINDGKDKQGNDQVQYFNLSAFDKQAELLEKYVKKGHKIMVVGRAKNESWDKPDGTKGYGFKVLISEIELLTSKSEAEKLGNNQPEDKQDILNNANAKIQDHDLPEIDIAKMNVQMPF
jgi:single-strand DNA-binding protein